MKKVIVTTTIYPPSPSVQRFQQMKDWDLVVVGDLKTPKDFKLERGIYVSPKDQEAYDPALSEAIGWNSIQRRNFGFLWAKDMGADIIATVDDDNVPLPGWGENLIVGQEVEANFYETDLPAFDPVGATNYPHLWHRGYPLQLVAKRDYSRRTRRKVRVDIQADFWNGDPDVDAICRMINAPDCTFGAEYFPLAANRISPFNSQNTFLCASVLPDYFMMPHVGRMDDIWASFYAQAKGHRVVFNRATVRQDRNVHDLTVDMRGEYLGYENNLKLIAELARSPESFASFLPPRTALAFELYRKHFKVS